MPSTHAVQVLREGLVLGESPRWRSGRLWCADWGAQELLALQPDGRGEVVARVPTMPFCLDWLPDGRLLVVMGGEARLARLEPGGSLPTHADLSGVAGPPWNEIVVDGRGRAYVNFTGFAFPEAEFAPGGIALVAPDGAVRRVADGLAFPNGMVVTADGTTLLVAESYASRLTAFTIGADGGLGERRVWAEVPGSAPDGICLDAEGAAWYGDVPNRACVRVREGGEVLDEVKLDRGCFACMLGGASGRTLFMVANDWEALEAGADGTPAGQVLAAEAPAPHAGRP